jgi:hypothetical protein
MASTISLASVREVKEYKNFFLAKRASVREVKEYKNSFLAKREKVDVNERRFSLDHQSCKLLKLKCKPQGDLRRNFQQMILELS